MFQPRILHNNANHLVTLAPGFSLLLDTLLSNRIVGFGLPGSGKTNLVALLAEQIGKYSIPLVIFDYEGDFLSLIDVLPRGVIATANNCPSGKDILEQGLQVIFDLASWKSAEAAASVMIEITRQLMNHAASVPSYQRVPCPIFLDEAHKWLPEKRGSFLSDDSYKTLQDAYTDVGSRGRKYGIISALFAQRISLLSKAAMFPGVYILLKQSMHRDLSMYMEYVSCGDLSERQVKSRIMAFPIGRGIIKLPDGTQKIVTFNLRESEHISHTPTAEAALKFSTMPFLPDASYGSFLPAAEMVTPPIALVQPAATKKAPATKARKKHPLTVKARITTLLKKNPDMTSSELAATIGVTYEAVRRVRKEVRVK